MRRTKLLLTFKQVACRERTNLNRILDTLDELGSTLSLFNRWSCMFPAKDYTELGSAIESVYTDVIKFLIDSVIYLRGNGLSTHKW